MSVENELRRQKKTNLEYRAKRLRFEIESLTRTIRINLDCTLNQPEDLPMEEIDGQVDELKCKWAELLTAIAELNRIEEALR